jgi:hypothetical protein
MVLAALAAAVAASAQTAPQDVPRDHWAFGAVDNLFRLGILRGYPDGTFKGSRPVSRYEMAGAIDQLHLHFLGVTGGLQSQLDVLRRTPRSGAVQPVNVEQLAEMRRRMDALEREMATVEPTRAEAKRLEADFQRMIDQVRAMRGDLGEMRRTLPPRN